MGKWTFGLNLGIFTVEKEVDLGDPDTQSVTRLFRRLATHAVLYQDYQLEYAGKVVESIGRLRAYVAELLDDLGEESVLEDALLVIDGLCQGFRDRVDAIQSAISERNSAVRLDDEALNVMAISPEFYRWQFIEGVGRLRGQIGAVLAIMSERSGIPVPRKLQPILPKKRIQKK